MTLEKSKGKDILKNKKLLILGGSRNDIEFIRYANQLGVKVGVTDWYDEEKSQAKKVADFAHDVSIADIDKLEELIKKENYDGVLTGFTDSYLEPYAEICERMNYPCYGSKELFKLYTNKSLYKAKFKEFGVPMLPSFELEEINQDFNNFPIIMKPVDGSGSVGIKIAYNYKEFLEAVDLNKKNNIKEIVIEPYIENRKELTAFFIIVDGKVYYPGSANRFLSRSQGEKLGLPILYTLKSSYEDKIRETILEPITKMFIETGIKNGIMFAQCLVHEGEIYPYDLGYRVTGTQEYKLFDSLYNVNTMYMLINHALTGSMNYYNQDDYSENFETDKVAMNITILGEQGEIKEINGIDSIKSIPDIIDATIKTNVGQKISENMIGTLGQIISRIFAVSDNLEDALNVIKDVYEKIEILDQNGNNMILEKVNQKVVYEEYKK